MIYMKQKTKKKKKIRLLNKFQLLPYTHASTSKDKEASAPGTCSPSTAQQGGSRAGSSCVRRLPERTGSCPLPFSKF